ncbi:assimilatory sulfite reductase (NADPH) flavoprotein subunit [Spectribacter hydrogenoxidans]|uniref:Sulfite reductase [NADPH] flavoprotein alpha-component n=1 Tax=Spectribacter hydrogenoxidans TaxID=3075608 RepID=A0ABU3BYA1_9GAMM|nr:assimilatory sulfite reductase (NADPH) flavoprotein subunit [Salinisphaera sp. W335]MDT0634240.1 assimilatory sulfite reductase (NADPH) flavoprotein subunit [Salinisphaera sp. W335]
MKAAQIREHSSPLDASQAAQLESLVESLSPMQATWISGYLAGLNAALAEPGAVADAAPAAAAGSSQTLTILYGSQTGNAEGVAGSLRDAAQAGGITARLADMADYKPKDLKQESNLVVVVSTHGEGEPPDDAEDFYEFLHGKKAPKLDGVRFSVLALGDSSYEHFCETGRVIDERLAELGGTRVIDRVDCDVDYDDAAEAWTADVLAKFAAPEPAGDAHPTVTSLPTAARTPQAPTRKNPHGAAILANTVLNGRGSDKEVRHIELDTEDSGLIWTPGDSLGVVPSNPPAAVDALLAALQLDGDARVTGVDGEVSLAHALRHQYEITTLTRPFVTQYAQLAESGDLQNLLGDDQRDAFADYVYGRDLTDLVREYPVPGLSASDFVRLLRKLPPRLYSIASSHAANPDELHLTVAAVRYHSHGRDRLGVASTHLADRVGEDDTVPVYIDANKSFKLPADNDTPLIMIGPGTGVAPFRAFLQEREEQGAGGDNWLFFGAPHFRTDFYYQTDWLRWRRDGLLSRLDVAFSRDQADKVYVQHRLREQARDVYGWLENGANVYVCGDADRMARDVHDALGDIIAEQGGMSADAAADYLKRLQKEKRYQRDVY